MIKTIKSNDNFDITKETEGNVTILTRHNKYWGLTSTLLVTPEDSELSKDERGDVHHKFGRDWKAFSSTDHDHSLKIHSTKGRAMGIVKKIFSSSLYEGSGSGEVKIFGNKEDGYSIVVNFKNA